MLTPGVKKKKVLILLGVILLLIILIGFTYRERDRLTPVEDFFISLASPIQEGVSSLSIHARDTIQVIRGYNELAQENAELEEELSKYRGLSHQVEELRQENQRLREMLDFQERSSYDLIPAKVIARDPSTWFNTLIINKGYNDGVARDMAVTTKEGLVGNVIGVSRHASKVLLLTDSRRAVSGIVQESRDMGTIGFVEGSVDKPGYCRMVNISREAEISRDDVIMSSGLGGVFPPGLVIGEVMEIGRDEYGLLQYAIIKPAVNFNRLEEVFVVEDLGEEILEEEEFDFDENLNNEENYQEETEGQEYNGQN